MSTHKMGVVQDRRFNCRVSTRIPCTLISKGVEREASILDISLTSAFLWQPLIPAEGSNISIKLEHSHLKDPLILEAKVIRTGRKFAGAHPAGSFAVRFSNRSPEFARLLVKLSEDGSGRTAKVGFE